MFNVKGKSEVDGEGMEQSQIQASCIFSDDYSLWLLIVVAEIETEHCDE